MRRCVIVIALVCLAACASAKPAATGPPSPAAEVLGRLVVADHARRSDYARARFGAAWADVDRNGCDTRNDILNRDLAHRQWRAGTHDCVVVAGDLTSPYSGDHIEFAKADASKVQIDHVVALGDAWQAGAAAWEDDRRRRFANDPLNLLAVDGRSNQAKGDDDASEWLPARRQSRCAYVARQVAVKAKWDLTVTRAEHDAMARVLRGCPGAALPA